MTRVNCVLPNELTVRHLVAEFRELPRIFGLVRKAADRGETPTDPRNPTRYTLGKGHVRFFYGRLGYLSDRHADLVREMQSRGYSPTFTSCLRDAHSDIPVEWWGDWTPDAEAMAINQARIAERIKASA